MKTRILLLCLSLLGASAFIARSSKPESIPLREPLSGIPMRLGNWDGMQAPDITSEVMDVLGVDDYINRIYYRQEYLPVSLYIGYYQSQRQGDTIHSPLNCLPGSGWNPTTKGRISIQMDSGTNIEINRIFIQKGTEKQVVLYWYQSHGRIISSEYWGKIYTVLDALRTNRTDAALVRVICPVVDGDSESEAAAQEAAISFVKQIFPMLPRFIPG